MKPLRLAVAQMIVPFLPPLPAHYARKTIYPMTLGIEDDYDFTVHAQTGSLLKHTTRDLYGHRFATSGYFNFRNWALAIALCKPGDTIVEVGSNVGTETVGFSDIVGREGRVIAFEPLPQNVAALETQIALNAKTNITVKPIALGDTAGKMQFALPTDTNSGLGQIIREGMKPREQMIEVECNLLDSYMGEIGEASLICMDAEDSEQFILRGAENYIQQYQPAIIVEARRKVQPSLHKVIETLGLKTFKIGRMRLSELDEVGKETSDWLCMPAHKLNQVARASRILSLCALMPCIPGLNPMTRRFGL